jgi:hypothetical protein
VLDAFESALRIRIAEMAPRRVFVHAGVVGRRNLAIILTGKSYTGKTTLVRELIRSGADYYSDEYAVLDAGGKVHPFLRPLEIRSLEASVKGRSIHKSIYASDWQQATARWLIVISA